MATIQISLSLQSNIHSLKNNWMHKVSMSSLELFYSNFFECMFLNNQQETLSALNNNLDNQLNQLQNSPIKPIIKREFHLGKNKINGKEEVTDIMIGFEATRQNKKGKTITFPWIIIENKVKSYPKNEQLKGQHEALTEYLKNVLTNKNIKAFPEIATFYGVDDKTNINNNVDYIISNFCHEILLTFIPTHKGVLTGTGFKQLLYKDFIQGINVNNFTCSAHQYVRDYIQMVNDISYILENLQDSKGNNVINFTTNNSLNNNKFYMADDFDALKGIAFQDVFRKYQASLLEAYLIQQFAKNRQYKNIDVRTESSLNDKNGTTTILLVLDGPVQRGQEDLSVGVQIQGNQFRIMVVGKRITQYIKNNTPFNNLPNCIKNLWNKNNATQGNGNTKNNGRVKTDYNSYKPNCIYKYSTINGNPTFKDIGNDIKTVLNYITQNRQSFLNNIP